MKKVLILTLILIISCDQKENLITNNEIGNFKLGEKLLIEFNQSEFDITLDKNDKINSIMLKSVNFKTKDNFGVGSKLNDLQQFYDGVEKKQLNLSKETSIIGNIGMGITYDGIIFIDGNKDDIVDLVWIHKNK